jgi:mannosyltransferase
MSSRRVAIWLALIVFGGVLLRLQNAAEKDFFYDEVFTYDVARKPVGGLMHELARDTSPPLYFLLLKGWIALSASYASIKLFPLVVGVFGIVSGYFLGAALFGCSIGLLTALLVAVSPFHVRFSQELRMYTLYPAFLSLAGASLVCALRLSAERASRRSTGYWWLFTLFNALALYTHYHAFFFIVAAYVFLLWYALRKRKRGTLAWTARSFYVLLGLSIALIPLLMEQMAHSLGKVSWVPAPSLLDLPRTYCIGFIYYFEAMPENVWMWIIAVVLFVVVIVFHARNRETPERREALLFLWFTAFLPIVVMFALSYGAVKFFYIYRYVIISLMPFLALLAYGISTIRLNIVRAPTLAAFIIIGVLFSVMQNERNYKPHWRRLAGVIDSRVTPKDVLIGSPGFYMNGYFFYSRKDHPILDFGDALRDRGFNPREFYFLRFNSALPEDTLFPRLLGEVFRRVGAMREIYSDWWFTLSWHTGTDFEELRRWYFNRTRIGKANLPTRMFLYFLDAADERLEGVPGFAPPQLDQKWEPYRWTFLPEGGASGDKVTLPLPGALPARRYRLWMKCNLEYPEEIKDYEVTVWVEGKKVYEMRGRRGVQLISAEFDLPAASAYPVVEFLSTTWVPKKWKVNEDERALAFRFYWLGIEAVVGASPSGGQQNALTFLCYPAMKELCFGCWKSCTHDKEPHLWNL